MDIISVVIPMYNSEKTIRHCLQSVICQTYNNIEIIIIDDGSTDASQQIVNEFSEKDPRIKYVRQPNGGVSRARNHGIDISEGRFICFIDSDDAVQKDYIQMMYEKISEIKSDFVICGYKEIEGEIAVDRLLADEDINKLQGTPKMDLWILRSFISAPWAKLFSMEIIKKHNLCFREDMTIAEDQYFNYHYLTYCKKISYINSPSYVYYNNVGGLSHKKTRQCFENEVENLNYKIKYMETNHIVNGEWFVGSAVCYIARRYFTLSDEDNSIKNCCARFKAIPLSHIIIHPERWQDRIIYTMLRWKQYRILYGYLWLRFKL